MDMRLLALERLACPLLSFLREITVDTHNHSPHAVRTRDLGNSIVPLRTTGREWEEMGGVGGGGRGGRRWAE